MIPRTSMLERWNGTTYQRCAVAAPTGSGKTSIRPRSNAFASRPCAGRSIPSTNGAKFFSSRFQACCMKPEWLTGGVRPGGWTVMLERMFQGAPARRTRVAVATV